MKMGEDPDFRFSLANERTFLAWIRTALAFLATAIGLDIVASHTLTTVPSYIDWLSPLLAIIALFCAIWAFLRWYQNEKAMRLAGNFHYSKSLLLLTSVVVVVSGVLGGLSLI